MRREGRNGGREEGGTENKEAMLSASSREAGIACNLNTSQIRCDIYADNGKSQQMLVLGHCAKRLPSKGMSLSLVIKTHSAISSIPHNSVLR